MSLVLYVSLLAWDAGANSAGTPQDKYVPGTEAVITVSGCEDGLSIKVRECRVSSQPGQLQFVLKLEPISVYITVFTPPPPSATTVPNPFRSPKLQQYFNKQWHPSLVHCTFAEPRRRDSQRRLKTNAGHVEGKIALYKGSGELGTLMSAMQVDCVCLPCHRCSFCLLPVTRCRSPAGTCVGFWVHLPVHRPAGPCVPSCD